MFGKDKKSAIVNSAPTYISEIKNKLIEIIELKKDYIQSDFEKDKKKRHLKKYLWKNTFNNIYEIITRPVIWDYRLYQK